MIKPRSSGPDGPFLAQSLASRAPASEFSDARATKEAPMEAREPTSRSPLRCAAWQAFQQLPGGPGSEERLIASPPGRPSSLVPSAEPGAHAQQSSKREGERACTQKTLDAPHTCSAHARQSTMMPRHKPGSADAQHAPFSHSHLSSGRIRAYMRRLNEELGEKQHAEAAARAPALQASVAGIPAAARWPGIRRAADRQPS